MLSSAPILIVCLVRFMVISGSQERHIGCFYIVKAVTYQSMSIQSALGSRASKRQGDAGRGMRVGYEQVAASRNLIPIIGLQLQFGAG